MISPRAAGNSTASGASAMADGRSSNWKIRSRPARACCPIVSIPGELTRRCDQLRDVGREREEGAERDLMAQGQPPAQREDRHLRESRNRLEQRLISRLQAHRSHLRSVEHLRGIRNALELAVLLPECLDDADTVQVLVDDLHEVPFALLPVPRRGKDAPAHPVRDDEHARHDDHAHQREQRRQIEHDRKRQHRQQQVAAHDRKETEQALDQSRVRVRPRHQLTGRHPVEVVEVQRLQMVVHRVAEVVLHRKRHSSAAVAAHVREAEARGRERDEQHQPRPERRCVLENHAVDDLAGDQRDGCLRNTAEHRRAERQEHVASMPQGVAGEAPDPAGLRGGVSQRGSDSCHPLTTLQTTVSRIPIAP